MVELQPRTATLDQAELQEHQQKIKVLEADMVQLEPQLLSITKCMTQLAARHGDWSAGVETGHGLGKRQIRSGD